MVKVDKEAAGNNCIFRPSPKQWKFSPQRRLYGVSASFHWPCTVSRSATMRRWWCSAYTKLKHNFLAGYSEQGGWHTCMEHFCALAGLWLGKWTRYDNLKSKTFFSANRPFFRVRGRFNCSTSSRMMTIWGFSLTFSLSLDRFLYMYRFNTTLCDGVNVISGT